MLWLEDGRLKDLAKLVRDPVCGMRLEPEEALVVRFEDRPYYFCSQACGREFEQEPAAYVARLSDVSLTV